MLLSKTFHRSILNVYPFFRSYTAFTRNRLIKPQILQAGEAFQSRLCVVPIFSAKNQKAQLLTSNITIDSSRRAIIDAIIEEKSLKGKDGEKSLISLYDEKSGLSQIALIGVGPVDDISNDIWRKFGVQVADIVTKEKTDNAEILLNDTNQVERVYEGVLSGLYEEKRYKSSSSNDDEPTEEPKTIEKLSFVVPQSQSVLSEIDQIEKTFEGIHLARDLVTAPPNVVTPDVLATIASEIAANCPNMQIQVFNRAQCEKLGMGSFLAVAQGSIHEPKFIHLTYSSNQKQESQDMKKLAVIGKGLTFDSGGYNLKVGASMIELMKFDMGGSAAVLGSAQALSLIQPDNIEVHFIVAACENMVSDRAYRPGDIITASNGKNIEVNNTDAEGRLTLADALVYAEKLNVNAIVDLATLTGACVVALGDNVAGLWSNNNQLAEQLCEASECSGDKIWRMPLVDEYKKHLKSDVADIQNTGKREGGAITAALFLKEFVKKTSWAHIDIAGPVWDTKKGRATGFGVSLLTKWFLKN